MLRFTALVALLGLGFSAVCAEQFNTVWEAREAAFKAEEQKLWRQIEWRRDPVAAQAEAAKANKPILVFMLIRKGNQKGVDQYCDGGRATRGRALSDSKVIEMLNKDFIPFELNLTDQKFPETMPALLGWNLAYSLSPFKDMGFTGCVVLTPDGKKDLGNAGDPSITNWQSCPQYYGDKFVTVLEKALKKYKEE